MFLVICVIWGSSFILMKKACLAFGPIGVGAGRVIGGAVALAVVWALLRRPWPLKWRDLPALMVVVAAGYVGPFVVQPLVINSYADSAFMGIMISLVPLVTILFSIPMLKIYPTRRELVGVVGGLVFMLMLLGDGLMRHISITGLLLAASVPLAYAFTNIYLKKRFAQVSQLALCLSAAGLAAMILWPAAVAAEDVRQGSEHMPLAILSLVLLGVVGTGLGPYLYYRLIQQRGPLFAGMVTYLIPLGAVAWGWFDNERITLWQLLALGGILAMVALVQLAPQPSPPHISPGVDEPLG